MVKIFYNPKNLEEVYAIATILMSDVNDIAILISSNPAEAENYEALKAGINEEIQNIIYVSEQEDNLEKISKILAKEKIFLFNIYPKSPEEHSQLLNFYDENQKTISGWIDSHFSEWDESALNYISEDPEIIKITQGRASLRSLKEMGFDFPDEWLDTYLAIRNQDIFNKEAIRCLIISKATEIIFDNVFVEETEKANLYSDIFYSLAEEIITSIKNKKFNWMCKKYAAALEKTETLKTAFKTNKRLFKKAYTAGRPVGLLRLGRINPYVNIQEIMYHGKRKYPWLCIVTYEIQGRIFLRAESSKISIESILKKYEKAEDKQMELFSMFENELLNVK